MKTIAAIVLAMSSLVTVSIAQAQERQVTVYSGPMTLELPASMLRGTAASSSASAGKSSAARKVRVVLQSPYGN